MKTMKKLMSIMLSLLMIVSIIPMTNIEASAANGIQAKIDLIRTIYDTGSYFTSDGYSHNMWDYSVCPEDPNNSPMPYRTCKCSLSQQTKKTAGLYSGAEVASSLGVSRWQCAAFATYVFYNIFNKDYGTCGTVSIDNAKLGDVVVFDWDKSSYSEDHYAIYLYSSGSNIYVYDANSDYNSKVVYGKAYAKSAVVKVFRASNYDSVNNSTPTPSIELVTGLAGNYYLQNKNTGYWLAVSEGKDASTQPINTWGSWGTDFRINLTASGNGYKMKFPEISSLLVNPYSDTPTVGTKINLYADVNDSTQWWGFEKVGDAYAIRCMYNTSLCLTANGTAQATLTTYTGAANQLWYLHPHTYTVSYNANGGSGAPGGQTKYFNEGLTLSSTIPTRTGYEFLGWSTSSTATSATYSAGSSFTTNANTTLYAVWKQNVKTYTIKYSANGGYNSPDNQIKTHDVALTLSSIIPERTGYDFLGWSTSSTATTPTYYAGGSFTTNADTTLYAVWKMKTYTISYDANGGTGAPASQTKTHGVTLTLSSTVPTRSGYTFLGWRTSSGATYSAGSSFTTDADTILYAVWQENVVVEPEVHVSQSSVNLKLGETESAVIYAWATDVACSYTIQYQIVDTNIVSCVWGDWNSEMKSPLTITAKSKGTTNVIVSVVNWETKEILDSVNVTVVVDCDEPVSVDFAIREPSTTTIRYKDGIVLHIDGTIPEGARVEWAIDSNAFDGGTYDNGMSCLLVSKNNGYATIVATLYDADNNVIATDSIVLRSNAGFFQKIGGFFRSLFGTTKVYDA